MTRSLSLEEDEDALMTKFRVLTCAQKRLKKVNMAKREIDRGDTHVVRLIKKPARERERERECVMLQTCGAIPSWHTVTHSIEE